MGSVLHKINMISSAYFLCDERRHCVQDVSGGFASALQGPDFPEVNCQNDLSKRDGTLPTKCQALLQRWGLLLMSCDMPVKVKRTTSCHVENDPCSVEGETDEWQLER